MYYKCLLLLFNTTVTYSLICDEILELSIDKKLTLQELQSTQPKDIVQCIAHLGRNQLHKAEEDFIWQSIIKFYNGIPNIPDKTLMLLHWVTPALTPEDYRNLTLSSIDVIQNFGLNYNLNEDQLSSIADRVREDFAGKEPEDYTYYDLTALRQILCSFNRSEIERIHPKAYKEAALIIGKLENCSPDVLMGFATLAIQKNAFGTPAKWTDATLEIIGNVAKYVPKDLFKNIKPTFERSQNKS